VLELRKVRIEDRRYVVCYNSEQAVFHIDEDKLQEEARYDGLWVLRTNTELSIDQVAF
jgi:hypothetical protein